MEKAKPLKYQVTLNTVGLVYKAEGRTIEKALINLGLEWTQIKGKGVIKITHGKDCYERLFPAPQLRRAVCNKLARQLWAKRLKYFLESDRDTNLPERVEPEEEFLKEE